MLFKALSYCAILAGAVALSAPSVQNESIYKRRVNEVLKAPGFVALRNFVKRDEDGTSKGRFSAYQAPGDRHDFRLDAINYVEDYWNQGRAATYDDFPLLGRGPFG